jgi:septal ring factor EnvC (AmiA/AmiB activator)
MITLLLLLTVSMPHAEDLPGTFSVAPNPRDTVQQTRQEERDVLDELARIDQDLEAIGAEVASLQSRREDLQLRQQALSAELVAAEADLQAHRAAITGWVRALYTLRRQGLARIIFGAEDPTDLRRRSTYLLAIIAADAQRFDDFTASTARRRQAVGSLESGVTDINALGAELQLKEAELKEQRSRKLELLNEIRSRRELALSVMQEMGRTRSSLGSASWGGWGGDQPAPSPTAASGQSSWGGLGESWGGSTSGCADTGSFRGAYGRLPWPVEGRLLRGFGPYEDPRTGQRERNDGLHITSRNGAPVQAIYSGTVEIAEYLRLYGYTVAVQHGAYTTVYAHLSGLRVRKGQQVCAGDLIGTVGDSGLTESDQEMLSFQVRYNNTPQDPLPWLTPR